MNILDLLVLLFYLGLVLAAYFLEAIELIFRALLYLPRKAIYLLCKKALVMLQADILKKELNSRVNGSQEQAGQNVFGWRHGLDLLLPNGQS